MAQADELTATQAAAALRELESYEEQLSYKAGAVTWMIFGIAGAGIFATYGMVGRYFDDIGMPWLYALPWIPWIAAAMLATAALWRMLNVALDRPEATEENGGAWHTLVWSLAFPAVGGLVWLALTRGFDVTPSMHAVMLIAVGAVTATMASVQAHQYCAPRVRGPFMVAGAALIIVGATMALMETAELQAGMTAALANLTAYLAAALHVFKQG